MVKDTTTLTTAYSGFTGDAVNTSDSIKGRLVGFLLDVSKGTGTTIEFKLEGGDEDADTDAEFYTLCKATGAIDERVITLATLGATDTVAVFHDVDVTPYAKVRLRVKHTGGATVTVKAYAVMGGSF